MMRLDPYRSAPAEAQAPQATFISGTAEGISGGYSHEDFNGGGELLESTFVDPELVALDSYSSAGGTVRLALYSPSGSPAQDVYTSIQIYDESDTLVAELVFADASYEAGAFGPNISFWLWTSEGNLFANTSGEQFTVIAVP